MENNNNPVVPSADVQLPEIPSVDDINVASMPVVEATAASAAETVEEAAAPAAETVEEAAAPVAETVEEAAAPVAGTVEETAATADEIRMPDVAEVEMPVMDEVRMPDPETVQVPVVEEFPDADGAPQYTSYVPASSDQPAGSSEVYTAPVVQTYAAPTPSYNTVQQPQQEPVRTVPVYVTNTAASSAGHGKAVASLILGIFSLFFSWCCCGGLIPGIVGICLGASAKSDGNKEGIATAGIIMSVIAVILSILLAIGMAAFGQNAESFTDMQDFYSEFADQTYGVIRTLLG